MGGPRGSTEDRFWRHVVIGMECWGWIGATNKGYGQLFSAPGRPPYKAHRVSYELHYGPVPEGMHVLHLCDNPPCCNPSHLVPGSQQENLVQMTARGRRHNQFG